MFGTHKKETVEKKVGSKLLGLVAGGFDAISIPTTLLAPFSGMIGAFAVCILLAKVYNKKNKESVLKRYGIGITFVVMLKLIPLISILPLWTILVSIINKMEKKKELTVTNT